MEKDQADAVADTYHERVLRNEGELDGLKQLVSETRTADQKLVDFKSQSIAEQLERTRKQLRELSVAERAADNREHRDMLAALEHRIDDYHSQAQAAYEAHLELVEQKIESQTVRLSELAMERSRAMDVALQSSNDAIGKAEQSHEKRFEQLTTSIHLQSELLNAVMPRQESLALHARNNERIQDLTDRINTQQGRTSGYTAIYGWAIAAIGLVITVVVAANALAK